MKFIKEEETNRQKTRYYFLLGRSEVTLMLKLVEKAYMYTPNLPITIPLRSTLRNMQVALVEALPQIDINNDWVDVLELAEKNGIKKMSKEKLI